MEFHRQIRDSVLIQFVIFNQEKFTPVKYFSIDRVFRNETLDATHLAEFHQIEGVVADYNISLGDLIGLLHSFFSKMGKSKLAAIFIGNHFRCSSRMSDLDASFCYVYSFRFFHVCCYRYDKIKV